MGISLDDLLKHDLVLFVGTADITTPDMYSEQAGKEFIYSIIEDNGLKKKIYDWSLKETAEYVVENAEETPRNQAQLEALKEIMQEEKYMILIRGTEFRYETNSKTKELIDDKRKDAIKKHLRFYDQDGDKYIYCYLELKSDAEHDGGSITAELE
ncbi:hypothetical protein B6U93_00380 [Candidatus Woesearchaeota archaeon ex4484_78]|nr:MAG: hypothetical protein B6U93_00380 [Candidatus Woesearchaeota archaeon ex4484_78]